MYRSYKSTNSSSSRSSSNLVESNNKSSCQSSISMGSGSSKKTNSNQTKPASNSSSRSQGSSHNSTPNSSEFTAQPDSNVTSKNIQTLQDSIMSEKIQGSTPRAVKWLDMNINNLMKDMNLDDDGQQWWKAVDKLIDKNPQKIVPDSQRKMWKTVRLFISSTFKDMNNEREYLVKVIIPVLRQWCEERKIRLIECDLRWGVPKDADTRETLMACLSEIDRCREENEFPYFLCMLSERYGYVCDPAEVPEDIKVRYNWLPGMSVTALEIFTGAYWDRNPHALYMLRDPGFLSNVKDKNILKGYQETKPESVESLQILKGKLREHYRDQIKEYQCELSEEKGEQLILTGFKSFGEDIIKHFKTAIENQYPATSLGEEMTDVEIQKGQQLDFLLQRSHFLVGRDEALSTMTNYINQDGDKADLLVLVGYPGAGKSSLMAYSAKQLLTNKTYKVFYHFVGATPDSTDPYSILTRFYKECMPEDDNMPPDLDSMLRYAQTMFQKASKIAKKEGYERLVIYFDALNQMDEDGETSRLTWLPSILTPELRIIVSTLEGDCLNALRSRDIKTKEVPVEPLNVEIRKDIVTKILAEYNKLLDQEQMQLLIAKDDAGRPLWLSLACEELRVTGVFRGLTEKIQNLPGDLSGLTQIILERVVKFYGEELVEASLCLLESSRFGLMESELLELLALAPITYSKNRKTDNVENGKILMAQWAFVYLGLKPFLRPFGGSGEGRLDFYHRSTSKVVRQVYLEDSSVKKWWHQRLADYFQRCTDSVRKAEELPFQLYQLDDKENLMKCLVSPDVFLHLCEEKSKQVLMKFWLWADNYEGAAERYIQFLDDFCQKKEENNPYVINLKSKIAWFLVDIGEYDTATELLKPFVAHLETNFGSKSEYLCEPLYALLTLYYRAGLKYVYGSSDGYQRNRQLGTQVGKQCVTVFEANYDQFDNKLGDVYALAGYFNSKYLEKARTIFDKNNNKGGLAQIYYMLGEKNQYHSDINVPRNLFEKSLNLCLSSFGKLHIHTARCYQLSGQMMWNRWVQNHDDVLLNGSLGNYINEVEILSELIGPHHPNVVRSREDVIIILENLGRPDEANEYREQQPEFNESL